jgi:hypothetical protein
MLAYQSSVLELPYTVWRSGGTARPLLRSHVSGRRSPSKIRLESKGTWWSRRVGSLDTRLSLINNHNHYHSSTMNMQCVYPGSFFFFFSFDIFNFYDHLSSGMIIPAPGRRTAIPVQLLRTMDGIVNQKPNTKFHTHNPKILLFCLPPSYP